MRTLLERVLCSLAMMMGSAAVTEAQNIYEGCGSSKKCLGFEKGLDDVQTTCLASQSCPLVLAYRSSRTKGYAHIEMMRSDEGFSEDRVMGKDAAIMATATTVTSRWNTALPKVSLQTQDIGVKNATVKATDKMLYAVMEVPLKFEARNPLDGATLKINMEYGCHFLAAAGPHSQSGPSYHHLKNAAEKLVTIENGDAARGWVAVGFGDDRVMGNDAVVMATATTLTSRWNAALPNQSLRTSDIGIKNATIMVNGNMLHVTMEMPFRFDTFSPLDGSNITVNFEEGCYFMVAAGQLNPWYGPNKHNIKNVAANLVKIEDEGESEDEEKGGAATLIIQHILFCTSVMILIKSFIP